MRFLLDAQLPPRLVELFSQAGHDAIHTCSLPQGNATPDGELIAFADAEDRVVVTKDLDFRDAHLLRGLPHRLLLVRTGNITNTELFALVSRHLEEIAAALDGNAFVELEATRLLVHEGGA